MTALVRSRCTLLTSSSQYSSICLCETLIKIRPLEYQLSSVCPFLPPKSLIERRLNIDVDQAGRPGLVVRGDRRPPALRRS